MDKLSPLKGVLRHAREVFPSFPRNSATPANVEGLRAVEAWLDRQDPATFDRQEAITFAAIDLAVHRSRYGDRR